MLTPIESIAFMFARGLNYGAVWDPDVIITTVFSMIFLPIGIYGQIILVKTGLKLIDQGNTVMGGFFMSGVLGPLWHIILIFSPQAL